VRVAVIQEQQSIVGWLQADSSVRLNRQRVSRIDLGFAGDYRLLCFLWVITASISFGTGAALPQLFRQLAFMFWLVIKGARPRILDTTSSPVAAGS
jgi:hypothetical protein